MSARDPRVDAYIAKSALFARPILERIREAVHFAVPEVEETMKWSMPFFDYKGPLCNMAAFKQHCSFGFWKAALIPDAGQRERITSVEELPSKKELVRIMKEAARLNDAGVKVPRKAVQSAKVVATPDDLASALAKNKKARAAFEGFPPSHRREYIEWIIGAKAEETRQRRLQQTIEWLVEGKSRNWKYEKK